MLSTNIMGLLGNPETPDHVLRDALLDEGITVAKVYVVFGHTGSYSDYTTWHVAGFLDESVAVAFKDKLNRWATDNHLHEDQVGNYEYWEAREDDQVDGSGGGKHLT